MVSPTTNFWVGIHSSTTKNGAGAVQAGIAATVEAIPANFTHDTILFAGPSSPRPSSDSCQFPSTCSSVSLVFACSNMGVKTSLMLKSTPNSCVTPRVVLPPFGTGRSINDTLIGFGDHLLGKTGKARVDPYDDFVLSHLGHWNDRGGYYYHDHAPYINFQEALLAVKHDAEANGIPFRCKPTHAQSESAGQNNRGGRP